MSSFSDPFLAAITMDNKNNNKNEVTALLGNEEAVPQQNDRNHSKLLAVLVAALCFLAYTAGSRNSMAALQNKIGIPGFDCVDDPNFRIPRTPARFYRGDRGSNGCHQFPTMSDDGRWCSESFLQPINMTEYAINPGNRSNAKEVLTSDACKKRCTGCINGATEAF